MVVPTNSYTPNSISRNVDSALYDCLHSFGLQSLNYLIKLQTIRSSDVQLKHVLQILQLVDRGTFIWTCYKSPGGGEG